MNKKVDELIIEGAKIIFRNFSGEETKFNRRGNRNFCVIIEDPDQAQKLAEDGWNVKIKPPREEGDNPFMFLPIKIKFNDRGPRVYLKTGRNVNKLDEETVSILDNVDILSVDLDVRPYDWEVNGKEGRTAYLQSMQVEQEIDRFAERFAEEEYPEE